MTEATRRRIALVAGGVALAAVIANGVHSHEVLWGGVVVLLLSYLAWRRPSPSEPRSSRSRLRAD